MIATPGPFPWSISGCAPRSRGAARSRCNHERRHVGALGPASWTPRTALGWQIDHILGYFGITLFFCFAWPRPFVVGAVLMAIAALLEALQAFTPDRSAYLPAAFYGAGGALAAALVAELVIRVWSWRLNPK